METAGIAVLAAAGLAAAWFLVPFALRRVAEARLARRCREARAIVLSYDDGPGPELTPRLLDLLKAEGVPASFFVLGRHAEASPGLVRRLVEEGHEVGSHTRDHANAWKTGPLAFARDLAAGIRTAGALGADRGLFRPPYGKMTLAGLADGVRRGLRYGWWTVDTRDSWACRPIGEVLGEIEAKGGGVVLMHDFDEYPRAVGAPGAAGASHAEHVLALTGRIIALARERGYRLMRLGDLGRDGAPLPGRAHPA